MEEKEMVNNINLAFDKYTTPWNSLDRSAAVRTFNNEVLIEVDKIYEYVSSYNVDWKTETMDTVLERLEKDVIDRFPYLNGKAIRILRNYFAYEWK